MLLVRARTSGDENGEGRSNRLFVVLVLNGRGVEFVFVAVEGRVLLLLSCGAEIEELANFEAVLASFEEAAARWLQSRLASMRKLPSSVICARTTPDLWMYCV